MLQILTHGEGSYWFVNRLHFGKQCLRSNILLIWPCDRTKEYADLIEIADITQFGENPMIKIGLEIKNSFLPTCGFDVNPII